MTRRLAQAATDLPATIATVIEKNRAAIGAPAGQSLESLIQNTAGFPGFFLVFVVVAIGLWRNEEDTPMIGPKMFQLFTMQFLIFFNIFMFSILSGWLGGALVSMTNPAINVNWPTYFSSIETFVTVDSIKHGLFKSAFFAGIIGVVSCHQGLKTQGGPRGVGMSVTRAVVYSLVLILISDYFVTRILMTILPE